VICCSASCNALHTVIVTFFQPSPHFGRLLVIGSQGSAASAHTETPRCVKPAHNFAIGAESSDPKDQRERAISSDALFCCLWRNVETSCHKHFVVLSRNQHRRLLPAMCHNLQDDACRSPPATVFTTHGLLQR